MRRPWVGMVEFSVLVMVVHWQTLNVWVSESRGEEKEWHRWRGMWLAIGLWLGGSSL